MKTIKYIAMTAVALAATLSSCNDAKMEPLENGIYIEQASTLSGFTRQIQSKTIMGENEAIPVTVRLMRPTEQDVHVTLAADLQMIDEYNRTNGKSYVILPDDYYTMKSDLTITAGNTSASADIVVPNGIPDGSYAISIRIATTDGPVIPRGDGNKILYLLRAPNKQTTPKLQPKLSGCTALSTTLGMSLDQWTIEYWVNFEDNGAAGATRMSYAWDSAQAGMRPTESGGPGWRFYVFAREAQPITGPGNLSFLFYPNGGEDKGPSIQFKFRGENIPSQMASNNPDGRGFLWKGNEWVHVAISFDNNTRVLRHYFNGEPGYFSTNELEFVIDDGYDITSWNSLTLGTVGSSASHAAEVNLSMCMAQVRLWNKVLEASDIQTNMSAALAGDEAGLVGYWKLNEAPGSSSFSDSCLNGEPHNMTGTVKNYTATVDFSNPNAQE